MHAIRETDIADLMREADRSTSRYFTAAFALGTCCGALVVVFLMSVLA